ncbi:MFS transporter [Streptomyces tubbatahanensis]|uniref:MFS transporter n=1 Tax=Streptomyces tubbatahanensis TaxID=2923272 RepID=A0ABY3XMB3_9ACTN|nr:MFS transporter [Streptomyces tubbatahanensis]UNS95572.1 MFS transporter [Streptomyces tubbatahanensis]
MATASTPSERPAPPPGKAGMPKAVVAGCIGNFIEQIDVGLYGYLAPVMAGSFFPGGDPTVALLSTYGTFAIGFLVQPLGGVIFGRMGDRVGRRTMLMLTIVLMGVLTACIGMLPTYAQVGAMAPALLLVIRILQGAVHGGEYGGALTFIIEYAPRRSRGLYMGYASLGVFGGLLVGAGLSALVSALLDDGQMATWGWRLPFLIALPLSLGGLLLRRRVGETPAFLEHQRKNPAPQESPIWETLRAYWRPLLTFTGYAMTNAVLSYTWVTYLPQWLDTEGGLGHSAAFASNLISLAAYLPLLVLAGWLSDRIGRKPMLLAGCVACVTLVPLAFWVAHQGSFGSAVLAQLIYLIPEFCIAVPATASLPEMVPTRVRVTATALGFNVPFSVFSGTAPMVATALVGWSGTLYAVSGYLGALAVISFFAVLLGFRETSRRTLAPGEAPAATDHAGDEVMPASGETTAARGAEGHSPAPEAPAAAGPR